MQNSLFYGVPNHILNSPWELVYFIHPFCDGNCKHCWSSDIELGSLVNLEWHKSFTPKLRGLKIRELKISGGEPFLNKDIRAIIDYIREYLPVEIPITIFTSGRNFLSVKENASGVDEIVNYLKSIINNFTNLSIHLSADEFHAETLYKHLYNVRNTELTETEIKQSEQLMGIFVKNFISACEKLKKENPNFNGGKLKIHCDIGRLQYHRNTIYNWMDDNSWSKYAIGTEGLIKTGNAKNIENATEIVESDRWSFFVLPGVKIFETMQSNKSVKYYSKELNENFYLDTEKNSGIIFAGWWNIINKTLCYKNISL